MAGITGVCPIHGRVTIKGFHFEGSGSATFTNSGGTCPRCGLPLRIPDGTYEFVGSVVKTFIEAKATRQDVEAFRDIVEALQQGKVSIEEGEQLAASIGHPFAHLLGLANNNGVAISVLLTIIGLFIAGYAAYSSDQSSDQAHADAQQQIAIQRSIYEELQRQPAPSSQKASPLPPTSPTLKTPPNQRPEIPSGTNRHERRKNAKNLKRQPPT